MLVARDITFSYAGKDPILRQVSLQVAPAERVGIVAPSGAGKTTLLKILGGYLQPGSGKVLVDGRPLPLRGYCPVQMVWQHPEKAVDPRLRLGRSLAEGDGLPAGLPKRLGIEEGWKDRYPRELSGGELQRFCIARALGRRTRYLLADEISTMLDLITQGQIWRFLMEETEKRQIGMVVVSHGRELLEYVCTRLVDLSGLCGREGEEK